MNNSMHAKVAVLAFLVLVEQVSSLPLTALYPFGREHGDALLTKGEGTTWEEGGEERLREDFWFYGRAHRIIHVGLNGVLSLQVPITSLPQPHPFPHYNRLVLIAPLWTDVDAIARGSVFFRQTQNTTLLHHVASQITETFGKKLGSKDFNPQLLFIVTWYDIAYRNKQNNTFQCVLATDGNLSFSMFLYTNKTSMPSHGDEGKQSRGYHIQVGFNSPAEGRSLSILTPSLSFYANTTQTTLEDAGRLVSNGNALGKPGLWIFGVHENNYLMVPGASVVMEQPRVSVERNAGQVTICAVLLDEIDEAIQVHLVTVDGTAKAGVDYYSTNRTLTFNVSGRDSGDSRACTAVDILRDTGAPNEDKVVSFTVQLISSNALVDTRQNSTAVVNILDQNVATIDVLHIDQGLSESRRFAYVCLLYSSPVSVSFPLTLYTEDGTTHGAMDYSPMHQELQLVSTVEKKAYCVRVNVVNDSILEGTQPEVLYLILQSSSNQVYLNKEREIIPIQDDDAVTVALEEEEYSVREDSGNVHVCARMEGSSEQEVVLALTTSNRSAQAGRDYGSTPADIVFGPYESQACTVVDIIDNNEVGMLTKTFVVSITSSTSGVKLGERTSAHVTIREDDVAMVTWDQLEYHVMENAGYASICAIVTGEVSFAITAQVDILMPAEAGDGTHETLPDITFEAGESLLPKCWNITFVDDHILHGIKTLQAQLSLSIPTELVRLGDGTTTVTIVDDDTVSVRLLSTDVVVGEGDGQVEVCVELEGGFDASVGLQLELQSIPQTATAMADFASREVLLTFLPGGAATSKQLSCVTIGVLDDEVAETEETFVVRVIQTNGSGAVKITNGIAKVTIIDNDFVTVGLEAGSFITNEGDRTVTVCVALRGQMEGDMAVDVTLHPTDTGSAKGGTDFGLMPFQLHFPSIESPTQTKCADVGILDDSALENNETFTVYLNTTDPTTSSGVRVIQMANAAVITILDNDNVRVGFNQSSYTADESDKKIEVCVILEGELEREVHASMYMVPGTAEENHDYLPLQNALVFKPTRVSASQCVRVSLVDDYAVESDENFLVYLNTTDASVVLHPVWADALITDSDVVCELSSTDSAYGNYTWSQALPGTMLQLDCVYGPLRDGGDGKALRYCTQRGKWMSPDYRGCYGDISKVFEEILKNGFSKEGFASQVVAVQQATDLGENNEAYVDAVAAIFDDFASLVNSNQVEVDEEVFSSTATIISGIQKWNETLLQRQSSRIVEAFEAVAVGLVRGENFTRYTIVEDGLVFSAVKESSEDLQDNGIAVSVGGGTTDSLTMTLSAYNSTNMTGMGIGQVSLPPSLFGQVASPNAGIFFSVYEEAVLFPISEDLQESYSVGSAVIAASVAGENVTDLKDPVSIVLRLRNEMSSNPLCVSWDFEAAGGRGNWSTEGCTTTAADNGSVTCSCTHLTNFAILVDIRARTDGEPPVDDSHVLALQTISITGVVLSLIGLLLTIISLTAFRKLRARDSSKFRLQLCTAMSCMLVVFVVGIERTEVYAVCVVMSLLLHYFTLVSVAWMGAEALLMFQKLVIVFSQTSTKYIVIISLVCWLLPIPAVVIPVAVDMDTVVSPNYCFVSDTYVLFGAFFGPIFAVTLFNFAIFLSVVYVLLKHSIRKFKDAKKSTKRKGTLKTLCSVIGIMVLFGLTWIFGAFTINEASLTFQYLFAIFNSFQGFFMFVFFCVLSQEVRMLWLVRLGIRKKTKGTTSSVLTRQSSSSRFRLTRQESSLMTLPTVALREEMKLPQVDKQEEPAEDVTIAEDPPGEAAAEEEKVQQARTNRWDIVFVHQTMNALMFVPQQNEVQKTPSPPPKEASHDTEPKSCDTEPISCNTEPVT